MVTSMMPNQFDFMCLIVSLYIGYLVGKSDAISEEIEDLKNDNKLRKNKEYDS